MKICALLVPREMQVEHTDGIKAMTDEQIDRAIAFIEEQLAKRDGSSAKVIDAEPLDVVPDSDNRNSD